jgi:hypothetical protein
MKTIIFLFSLLSFGVSIAQENTGIQKTDSGKDAGAANVVAPDNTIHLILPIEFADSNSVRQEIKDECELPKMVERNLIDQAYHEKLTMEPSDSYNGEGVAMRVSIIDVSGFGGGIYTGTKDVKTHVELFKDGAKISDKDFERRTVGASWSGLTSGACSIFAKLMRPISILSIRWAMEQLSIESVSQKKARIKQRKKLEEEEKSADKNE